MYDTWAAGVLAVNANGGASTFSASDILIVADDAMLDASGVIIASRFFIAPVALAGSTPWIGGGVSIALEPNPTRGGGRCCGPALGGEQKDPTFGSGPTPPGCTTGPGAPISLCDWGAQFVAGGTIKQDLVRQAAGLAPIEMKLFSGDGLQMTFSFAAPLGGIGSYRCTDVRPLCTIKKYGPDGWVEKEWNKGHTGNPDETPEEELEDHVHDYVPNPRNPSGRPDRQPGRPPNASDADIGKAP